jgi:tRNA(Ile)-lysidine synthase
LRGIAARRPLASGVELIRPLLTVTRQEVLHFLASRQMSYCEDRSNVDLSYTRNRIRHRLLPHLAEQYNPAIASVLARLARQAASAYALIEELAARTLAKVERPRAGTILVFDQPALLAVPVPLLREVFRLVWARESWPLGEMAFAQWQRLAEVARGERNAVDLPGGVRARQLGHVVQVWRVSYQ